MSRTWDKAKAGASWLGKVGLVAGAAIGAIIMGGAAAAIAPGSVGIIAVSALIGAGIFGAGYGIEGGILGGLIGGVYGAVSDDPKEKTAVAQQQAPAKAAPSAQDIAQDGPASSRFQDMVNESRANSATTQR